MNLLKTSSGTFHSSTLYNVRVWVRSLDKIVTVTVYSMDAEVLSKGQKITLDTGVNGVVHSVEPLDIFRVDQ
jgi:hypothetical protein